MNEDLDLEQKILFSHAVKETRGMPGLSLQEMAKIMKEELSHEELQSLIEFLSK